MIPLIPDDPLLSYGSPAVLAVPGVGLSSILRFLSPTAVAQIKSVLSFQQMCSTFYIYIWHPTDVFEDHVCPGGVEIDSFLHFLNACWIFPSVNPTSNSN